MPATLMPPAKPIAARPAPARRRPSLEELVRRAAVHIEKGPRRIVGTFRQVRQGRPLTRLEKGMMALIGGGLGLAIWLHALPVPVSAHATHYQSITATHTIGVTAPLAFAESALRSLGSDWRPGSFFTLAAPAYWQHGEAQHPNHRVERIEHGLSVLAAHGPLISVQCFPSSEVVTEQVNGTDVLASRVSGQIELTDGTVLRFAAMLVQDPASRRWGFAELAVPGFLP